MPSDPSDRAQRFVSHIATRAREDTGTRAALRSGLGREPEQCHRLHPYVVPWLSAEPHPDEERAFYTIAALIAHAPDTAIPSEDDHPGNIGGSLARGTDQRALAEATTENYVHLLVRQNSRTLCRYLTTVVLPLRDVSKPVPVDFARLLNDVRAWPRRQQQIAKKWLQGYYRSIPGDTTT